MKRTLLGLLLLSLPLSSGCFRHGRHGMRGDHGMGDPPFRARSRPWPTVRIDEPAGALVVMERGVFGDGISATAPLEGRFQPTATAVSAGYPLELRLDGAAAQRLGAERPVVLYARLTVRESDAPQGTLVIAPSECALRALVAGDLEELRVPAEALPTADQACANAAKAAAGQGCPMHAGQGCPMHAAGKHGGCGHHGCGARRGHWPWNPGPGAQLTLRVTKF